MRQKKYGVSVGVILGLLLIAAVLLALSRDRYTDSVRSDLRVLATATADVGNSRVRTSFDQVPMSDDLRLRQVERGYIMKSRGASQNGWSVCGYIYSTAWRLHPDKQICFDATGELQ